MDNLVEYLDSIENPKHRERVEEVIGWIDSKFPDLVSKIAWNQPMFTDHNTYIIGFSVSKNHMAVAPEEAGIKHFSEEIKEAGYDFTKGLMRIPWKSSVDFSLLERMIVYNIMDKADCTTFWRK